MTMSAALPDFANASLAELARWAEGDAPPPVDQWQPARAGTNDIRIGADGRWWHEGGEIGRPAMVRLFSRVLRREADGSHVLVTPAEKLTITVEDTPFIALEMKRQGEGAEAHIAFRLNTDEVVLLGRDHVLRVEEDGDGHPRPLLQVRGAAERALWARLARPVWLELVDLALADPEQPPGIWSDGMRFSLASQ